MDQIPDKEDEFKQKLGINDNFLHRNAVLQMSVMMQP